MRDTRVTRFPVREPAYAGSLMRRCFTRVLLLMNLVGEESPRCLTLSADRTKKDDKLPGRSISELSSHRSMDCAPYEDPDQHQRLFLQKKERY